MVAVIVCLLTIFSLGISAPVRFLPRVDTEDNKKPSTTRAIIKEQEKEMPKKIEGCSSVVDVAATMPELSIWMEALTAANLVQMFSDPIFNQATFLSPTNNAFLAFFDYLGVDKEAALVDSQMRDILLFHVLPVTATKPVDKDVIFHSALTGKDMRMVIDKEIVMYFGFGSRAYVVNQLEICQGAIQVIDEVLMSDLSQLAITCSNQSANALRNQSSISLWVCDRS